MSETPKNDQVLDIVERLKVRLRWAESNGYEMLANDLRDTIQYIELTEMARRLVQHAKEHHTEPGARRFVKKMVRKANGG
jgi:predicted nucleic acid-binding OB-fold protein